MQIVIVFLPVFFFLKDSFIHLIFTSLSHHYLTCSKPNPPPPVLCPLSAFQGCLYHCSFSPSGLRVLFYKNFFFCFLIFIVLCFCRTTWICHNYTSIPSDWASLPSPIPPLSVITEHQTRLPVLSSNFSPAGYSTHVCTYVLMQGPLWFYCHPVSFSALSLRHSLCSPL